jgi:ABC-type uncharacterized transport system substrate-binding protein
MMRMSFSRMIAVVAPLVGLASAGPALAHPHLFTEVKAQVLFDAEKRIAGIGQVWVFDDVYSATALDGYDPNGDGKVDATELAAMATENMTQLKEYSYFTEAKIEGTAVPFGDPIEAVLNKDDKGVLSLSFILPVKDPQAMGTLKFIFKVYDPDNFIAFNFANVDGTVLGPQAPAGCGLTQTPPDPNALTDTMTWGESLATAITIACP